MPERAREIVELLAASGAGAGIGAGITGFFAWMNGRKTGEAAIISAAARLQEVVNEAATHANEGLRADLDRVKGELEAARHRIAALEGDKRQSDQKISSLISILQRNGIPIEEATAPGAVLTIEGDRASVMPPKPSRRKR